MKSFSEFYEERQLEENFVVPGVGIVITLDQVLKGAALALLGMAAFNAVKESVTDLMKAGIRVVARNPLKSAFVVAALDEIVNNGSARKRLVAYLQTDFGDHANTIVDTLKTLIENGVSKESALDMVMDVIK